MSETPHVMIVDDSTIDADFARVGVAASLPEARVTRHAKGEDALAFLEDESKSMPGLVLLDLKMPGMGGIDVLVALRRKHGPGELPVVVFTSSREPMDIAAAYHAGANSYVVKPVASEAYLKTVSSVVHYWIFINQGVPGPNSCAGAAEGSGGEDRRHAAGGADG